jgi:ELWxxDGT repeat protein
MSWIELSLVIPVFNGSDTIGSVVESAHNVLSSLRCEIILVNDGSSDASGLMVFSNALYFAAFTTASGRELWKTTPGGVASEVADIDPFGSSDPADLAVFNNELYFSAFAPATGRELWK